MTGRCGWILALVAFPLAAQAPATTLRGTVRDSLGGPLRDVVVSLVARGALTHTDSAGRFQFTGLPGGETRVEYRRLGFAPETTLIALHSSGVDTVAVVLRAIPAELAGVEVTDPAAEYRYGMAGFNRRRTQGNGHYITRAEIEARDIHSMSDALRLVPGVQLMRQRDGSIDLRFGRNTMGNGHDCPPDWLIDGIRAPGLRLDDISADDVQGIEVYSGASQVPPEFNISGGGAGCGVIVLWTKRPSDAA